FRWTSLAPRSTAALRIARRSTWSSGADGVCNELSVMGLSASEVSWWKELGHGRRAESALARRSEEDRREGQEVRLPGVDRVVDADHRALHLRCRVDADVLVGDEPALEVGALDVDALAGAHVVALVLSLVVAAVAVGDDDERADVRVPGPRSGIAVRAVAATGRLHAHQRVLHHESARQDDRPLADVRGLGRRGAGDRRATVEEDGPGPRQHVRPVVP